MIDVSNCNYAFRHISSNQVLFEKDRAETKPKKALFSKQPPSE